MIALCMIMHKILLNFRRVGFNKTCTTNPDHYACTKPKAATERIKFNTRRVCSTLGHPPTATENRDESWSLRTRAPDGRALVRTSMQPLSVCLLARQRLSRHGDCRRLTEKKELTEKFNACCRNLLRALTAVFLVFVLIWCAQLPHRLHTGWWLPNLISSQFAKLSGLFVC